jgi:chemotaxis protein MotA
MIGAIGILVIFIMVFGGYLLAGGKLGIILKALPFEMITIFGAAAGAFLANNQLKVVKSSLKGLGTCFKGSKCFRLFRFKFFFWGFTDALLGCNREKF